MIRAVIFDVGGVLVRTEDYSPRRKLEERLGLAPGEAEHLVYNSDMGRAAQHGQVSSAELWRWVQEQFAFDAVELQIFREQFWGGDRLNQPLIDLVHRLRPRYQTAIISNAMDDLNQTLAETYPIANAFDLIVGSAYEGIMKPDAEIFRRTLARLGRLPEETIFVDDFAHNVEGAQAIGMHALHYTPQIDLAAALASYGVAPIERG